MSLQIYVHFCANVFTLTGHQPFEEIALEMTKSFLVRGSLTKTSLRWTETHSWTRVFVYSRANISKSNRYLVLVSKEFSTTFAAVLTQPMLFIAYNIWKGERIMCVPSSERRLLNYAAKLCQRTRNNSKGALELSTETDLTKRTFE